MPLSGWESWFNQVPLWLIGASLFAAMGGASFLGYGLHRAQIKKQKPSDCDEEDDYVVSAVLGLLALLMGFTFSLSIDRFDTRRELVLEEANTIGKAYLRTQLLEAPHRARISQLLMTYTDTRIALASASQNQAKDLVATNDRLIAQLWTATMAAFPSIKSIDFSSAYLDSMNGVIDLDAARKTASHTHVPAEVFFVLFIYLIVAASVLGYVLIGVRGRISGALLTLLFILSLLLIIDIDRPASVGVPISQEPMLQMRATLIGQFPQNVSPDSFTP